MAEQTREAVEEQAYVPRHLTREQVIQLYAQDLQQAEAGVRARWQALVTARQDYADALRRLDTLERERERVLGSARE